MGFRHILTPTGKVIHLLRGQAKLKMKKKFKFFSKLKQNNLVDDDYLNSRLNAYKGHLKHSDAYKFLYLYKKKYNL